MCGISKIGENILNKRIKLNNKNEIILQSTMFENIDNFIKSEDYLFIYNYLIDIIKKDINKYINY